MNKITTTCMICGNSSSFFTTNSKKNPVYNCQSCHVYFVKILENTDQLHIKTRYKEGNFWEDTNYNIEKMIESDFTDPEGKHFALNWKSMYSYCKSFLYNKKNILEIGVGTGVHSIMFDKMGFHVTGIEPDSRNVLYINKKLRNSHCISNFIEDFQTKEKFDVIWLYHTLEHIIRPDLLLKKCHSFLQNDGIMIIAVPDCGNMNELQSSINNPDHLWHFSKNSLKKLAVSNGYNVLRCESLTLIKQLNIQRIHRIINNSNLTFLSNLFWPYWPFKITNSKDDGYEIRVILKKQMQKIK